MQQDYYSFNPMNPLAAMSPMAMNAMGMQQQMNPFYAAYGNNYFAAAAAAMAQQQQQQQQQPAGMHPFANYPIGHTLPTQQRSATVADRMRKSKQKFASSDAAVSSSVRRFEDVSNSTDESIHLVRSRKNGETAPIRYVDVEPKRRTQSGTSIMKSSQGECDVINSASSSKQKQRSQSGDRCDSPIGSQGGVQTQQSSSSAAVPISDQQQEENVSVKSGVKNASSTTSSNIPSQQQQINKKKKEKKPQQSSKSMNNSTATSHRLYNNFADSVEHVYLQQSAMQYPQMQHGFSAPNYSGAGCYPDPWSQQAQPQAAPDYLQQSSYPQNAIVIEAPQAQQQQQSQGYYGYGSAGYDAAPGGPGQCQPQCPPQCAPQPQQQEQQQVAISIAYQQPPQQQQAFYGDQQSGYGDQSCGQYGYDQAPAQTIGNCPPSQTPCLPPGAKLVAEYFLGYLDEQQAPQCSNSQQSCNHQNQCYYPQSQSSSESSKEDVDIEVWEKQRGDTRGSYSDYEDNGYQSGYGGYGGYNGSNAYSNGYSNGSNAFAGSNGYNGSNAFSSAGYASGSNGYANGSNAYANGSNAYAGSNAYPGSNGYPGCYPNYNNGYSGYPNGSGDYCNNQQQQYPNYSDQSGNCTADPYGQQQQPCADPNCTNHGSSAFGGNYQQPSASTASGAYGSPTNAPCDDLNRIKDDIIKAIQNELGNLKLQDGKSDPIQPIFLMPKGSGAGGENKPIYIPRNIYVPVIRPVFVPRERIIVRPQIIHVARPVLVDRPVPIQQRPIVIERDRPVPVRVETIEKTEPCGAGGDSSSVGGGETCNEVIKNIENGQEVTYHEFTQTFPANPDYSYQEPEDVINNLQCKSNDDLFKYHQHENSANSKLESVLGNSQGYTLEVLDQRISDKFEKTDTETIKARYGVESYQYLPPDNSSNNLIRESSTSALSAKRSAAEFYSSTNAAPASSSASNKNNDTASVAKTSSSNIYNFDSSTAFAGGSVSPRK